MGSPTPQPTPESNSESTDGPVYEHKIIETGFNTKEWSDYADEMNELGKEGWKLVDTLDGGGNTMGFILVRQVE